MISVDYKIYYSETGLPNQVGEQKSAGLTQQAVRLLKVIFLNGVVVYVSQRV